MILELNFPVMFANVTQAQIDEILADQQANYKQHGNTYNWYWHHCLRVDGKIHPKFWNNVMCKLGNTSLYTNASMWLEKQGRTDLNPYVLLAAALKQPAAAVLKANPSRLTVRETKTYSNADIMASLRASGALVES
jgi:hypothetical protein